MAENMKKLVPNCLYDQVFENIKRMIRSGEFKPGDLLPGENALAEMMGVSRVTIRQALKRLSEAGVIRTYRGKGSVVAVDWKGLLDEGEFQDQIQQFQEVFFTSTQARRLIEPMVSRQAALSASEEDIARMERALQNKEEHLVMVPLTGRSSELVDFHTALWMSLHNDVLMKIWEHLAETSATFRSLPLVAPVHRAAQKEEAQRQHEAIFCAVRDHNQEYAYIHMLYHCDWIKEVYGRYFNDFLK